MIKRKKHISFISIFILVVMLLSTYPIASSANETNNSDGVELEDESIYDFCSNNKVIVSLKNTALVNSTELYSIYSDDYSTINNNAGTILAASTSEIEEVLNLGIDISKMELLNPSISSSIYGTYEFGEENNNIFSVEFENNSLGEVLDTLNSNPNINYAEPNYYYHTFETPNDLDYELQYALSHINAEDAWENVTGNNNVVVGI